MSPPPKPSVRDLWDERRHTTADIAKMLGMSEALVSRIVSAYVAQKAEARRGARSDPFQLIALPENGNARHDPPEAV